MTVREIQVKDVITKSDLPVCDYSVNPYTGCEHACKYCYACFMKRFTRHEEAWGDFVDVKFSAPKVRYFVRIAENDTATRIYSVKKNAFVCKRLVAPLSPFRHFLPRGKAKRG